MTLTASATRQWPWPWCGAHESGVRVPLVKHTSSSSSPPAGPSTRTALYLRSPGPSRCPWLLSFPALLRGCPLTPCLLAFLPTRAELAPWTSPNLRLLSSCLLEPCERNAVTCWLGHRWAQTALRPRLYCHGSSSRKPSPSFCGTRVFQFPFYLTGCSPSVSLEVHGSLLGWWGYLWVCSPPRPSLRLLERTFVSSQPASVSLSPQTLGLPLSE